MSKTPFELVQQYKTYIENSTHSLECFDSFREAEIIEMLPNTVSLLEMMRNCGEIESFFLRRIISE